MEETPRFEKAPTGEITQEAIRAEFIKRVKHPMSGDRRVAAIADATADMFSDHRLASAVQEMIDFHEHQQSWHLMHPEIDEIGRPMPFPLFGAYMISASYQREMLDVAEQVDYPAAFLDKDAARHGWRIILDDPDRYERFSHNLIFRTIQTNIPDRYKGPKAVVVQNLDRFNGPIKMCDVGSSWELGYKKMMLNEPFWKADVMDWYAKTDYRYLDKEKTRIFNERLRTPVQYGSCVGVDILPGAKDKETAEWIYACSFYPSELLDTLRVGEFRRLSKANLPGLTSVQGDFANPEIADKIYQEAGENKFDVITLVTVLHQLRRDSDDLRVMLDNALEMLTPNGLIIIQDFVHVRNNSPNSLYFPPEWKSWDYRTLVIDPSTGVLEPREVLYFQNARCRKMMLAEDF